MALTHRMKVCQSVEMDKEGKTFSLRYVGQRFHNARLPLDVLPDLTALRDLIAALVKQEFRQKNPDRKRVPQGYNKSISFTLVGIEEGSAVPVLRLENDIAQQNLPAGICNDVGKLVERGFQRVAEIVDAADSDESSLTLPRDAIRALSRFGANLKADERIEFQNITGADGKVISFDNFRRKKLLAQLQESYTVAFEGIGTLAGTHATNNSIDVQTDKYGELKLPLSDIASATDFDGNLYASVEFSTLIELDADDKFRAVKEVYSVELVQPYAESLKRCQRRLQELARLKKGWLGDNEGEQLVHLAAMRAHQFIFMHDEFADLFRIFPTEDGGISIEFDKDDWSFAVEILPDGLIEIDGSSTNGKVFEAQSFNELSQEFIDTFKKMILMASNDEN